MTPQMGEVTTLDVNTLIAAHAAIGDAHHSEVHGAAQHNDVTRELFIPANSGHVVTGSPSVRGRFGAVTGTANTDQPAVYFSIKVPDDFVSFTSLKAVWMSPAAAGNMRWAFLSDYAAPGEVYSTHGDDPAVGVTATGGADKLNVQESANPITLASLVSGDYIGIGFSRSGSHADDTLDDAMYLLGLLFTYVAEQ
ncbi:hypothetical protein ES703_45217 [subsurface metagenome]